MGDAHSSHQILLTLTLLIGSNDYHLQPNCETQRLTDQKLSSSIFPCCCSLSVRPSRMVTSPLYDILGHTNHIFSESSWSRISKLILPSVSYSNTQIQIHKYTNTQIQHITKCQKDPTCGIFLKRGLFRGIKNDIHMCQTHKYKNTNTQIHKYTNTAYDKVPDRPNPM